MGSFPTILKFDSLGWYLIFLVYYQFINTCILLYFNQNYFFNKIINTQNNNKLQLTFSKNIFLNNTKSYFIPTIPFKLFFKNRLLGLTKLLFSVFRQNKNILLVDYNYNYNYLPIENQEIFSRSNKNLGKFLKYFNVSVILFLNLNKKKFIFKKLQNHETINIALEGGMYQHKFDLCLNIQNTKIINYMLYIYVMGIYLNVKNNNLNTSGSALFIF